MGEIDNKKDIPTSSGKSLEAYKCWYYKQPKVLRVAILPAIITVLLIIVDSSDLAAQWFLIPASILCWSVYNQYLDSLLVESLKIVSNERDKWKEKFTRFLHFNNSLRNLVADKSETYISTVDIASKNASDDTEKEENRLKAINYVREEGSLKNSLDRIMSMLYQVFQEYADKTESQKFRVTYLVPNEDMTQLEPKSWYNNDGSPPKSVNNSSDFKIGDRTLAGYLWSRDGDNTILIDNVGKHIQEKGEMAICTYTHQGQRSYLKSLLCHKVIDPKVHTCLGLLCIDTNVPDTLTNHKTFYEIALEAAAKRILFETRFAYMKEVLQRKEPIGEIQ